MGIPATEQLSVSPADWAVIDRAVGLAGEMLAVNAPRGDYMSEGKEVPTQPTTLKSVKSVCRS